MNVAISYRTLLRVEIRHDFVLSRGSREFDGHDERLRERIRRDYSIHEWLRIRPAADTLRLMANHRLRLRLVPDGFAVAGSVEENAASPGFHHLRHSLPDGFRLRFAVDLRRPSLLREANVPERSGAASAFVFSNASGHADEGQLHLSRPIPAFDSSARYGAGAQVVDNAASPSVLLEAVRDLEPSATPSASDWLRLPHPRFDSAASYTEGDRVLHEGAVFEAVRDLSAPPALAAPDGSGDWRELYRPSLRGGVTANDLVHCFPATFSLPLESAPARAEVSVRDEGGNLVFSETQRRRDGNPLAAIEVRLPDPPAGTFTLEARDENGAALGGVPPSFYHHPEAGRGVPFAIIDLRAGTGELALFAGDGALRSPEFLLRFRHRHAFWRYEFSGAVDELPPADPGDLSLEDPAVPTRYTTARPLPLTAGMVPLAGFGGTHALPNPGPSSLRREDGRQITEVFMTL